MRLHAKVVAWVYLLYGIAGLALAAGEGDVGAVFVGRGFGIAIGGFLAAVSLPNAVAGYGLPFQSSRRARTFRQRRRCSC